MDDRVDWGREKGGGWGGRGGRVTGRVGLRIEGQGSLRLYHTCTSPAGLTEGRRWREAEKGKKRERGKPIKSVRSRYKRRKYVKRGCGDGGNVRKSVVFVGKGVASAGPSYALTMINVSGYRSLGGFRMCIYIKK